MRKTLYKNPLFTIPLRWVGNLILWKGGWRFQNQIPKAPKMVLIGAPHSSNWDFVLMLAYAFRFRETFFWMGKNSLFRFPFGGLMRYAGGISIDRKHRNNVVEQLVEVLNENQEMILINTPEGTRTKVEHWKSGFYWIAYQAKVPICPAYIDWENRQIGFFDFFIPTGDYEADLPKIQALYAGFKRKEEVGTPRTASGNA